MSAPASPPIADSVFFKLVRVVNLTARPFVETIGKAHRLTLNEWRVLVVLAAHAGISAQEVSAHTGLDKMTVSRALASLARHGRVVRRDDTADKRRSRLTLSAAGRRVYEQVGASGELRRAQLFAGIGEGDLARLERTLERMVANLLEPAAGEAGVRTRTG